jgi:mRNA deadenylase 3'-5' endonuclease subunit Ccr4
MRRKIKKVNNKPNRKKTGTKQPGFERQSVGTWIDKICLIPITDANIFDTSKANDNVQTVIPNDDLEEVDDDDDDDNSCGDISTTGISNSSTNVQLSAMSTKSSLSDKTANDHNGTISIVSWNVLAEAYCSRRSHRNLPHYYQNHVFNQSKRSQTICNILKNSFAQSSSSSSSSAFDVICLQEVDLNVIGTTLRTCGYRGIETPRSVKGNNGGRVDACAVYVNERGNWRILKHEIIYLDDIATLSKTATNGATITTTTTNTTNLEEIDNNEATITPPPSTVRTNIISTSKNKIKGGDKNAKVLLSPCNDHAGNNLQGVQQAFLRRNVAILIRIQNITTNETVVVANAHLFWNPGFEYVKVR